MGWMSKTARTPRACAQRDREYCTLSCVGRLQVFGCQDVTFGTSRITRSTSSPPSLAWHRTTPPPSFSWPRFTK